MDIVLKWRVASGLYQEPSFIDVTFFLAHLLHKELAVAFIKVYRSYISSVLRIRNLPDPIQEEAVFRAIAIERPRLHQSAPSWNLGLVLRQFMLPPFPSEGFRPEVTIELLIKKTAFLVALAAAARTSEFCALSRLPHYLQFTRALSGQAQVSIRCFPGFFAKISTPEVLLESVTFPGTALLFPGEPDRRLCPVRCLSLCID